MQMSQYILNKVIEYNFGILNLKLLNHYISLRVIIVGVVVIVILIYNVYNLVCILLSIRNITN